MYEFIHREDQVQGLPCRDGHLRCLHPPLSGTVASGLTAHCGAEKPAPQAVQCHSPSAPSAPQDRENLIHETSILLQAEVYKSALFFQNDKDRPLWLGVKKKKGHLIFGLFPQFKQNWDQTSLTVLYYRAQTCTFYWFKILKYLCIRS